MIIYIKNKHRLRKTCKQVIFVRSASAQSFYDCSQSQNNLYITFFVIVIHTQQQIDPA